MSNATPPLGKSESQELEFKSVLELENIARGKSDLGRSIVALLNSEKGGVLWIGVKEANSVAVELENLPNPQTARDAIWNHVLSTIDPVPSTDELAIELVRVDEKQLLRLDIQTGSQRPYSFLRQGRRYYVRSDRRVRDMTREELVDLLQGAQIERGSPGVSDCHVRLKQDLEGRRKKAESTKKPMLWMGLAASLSRPRGAELVFDLDCAEERRLLTDAKASGNRQHGTLLTDRLSPRRGPGCLFIAGSPNWGRVEIAEAGRVEQHLELNRLLDSQVGGRPSDLRIQPLIWVENVTSPCRLMGALLRDCAEIHRGSRRDPLGPHMNHVEVVASVAMLHAEGARLRPRFGFFGPPLHDGAERALPTEFGHWMYTARPMSGAELVENPDKYAYRLCEEFFRAFEFDPLNLIQYPLPPYFDRRRMRLEIPE